MRPLVCGMKIQQLPAESVKVTTWGLAVVLLCYCPFAHAQTSKTSAASADRAALTTYTDRLIRNGDLAALTQESEDDRSGTTGHARSLIIEASVAQILPSSNTSGGLVDANSQAQNEFGVVVMGRYQTDNYGLLGLDASVRFASAQSGLAGKASARDALVTLSTRDFPLGGGLMADGSVGQVIESTIPLARDQSRFFLPISPLLGASLILRKLRPLDQNSSPDDPDVSSTLNLTIGEPGTLSGLHLRNFSQLGGILVTGGGQVTISPGISAGIQAILNWAMTLLRQTALSRRKALWPAPISRATTCAYRAMQSGQILRKQDKPVFRTPWLALQQPTALPALPGEHGSTASIVRENNRMPQGSITSALTFTGGRRPS
jgi:hypothetical protein